jgi:hypothetical protein
MVKGNGNYSLIGSLLKLIVMSSFVYTITYAYLAAADFTAVQLLKF